MRDKQRCISFPPARSQLNPTQRQQRQRQEPCEPQESRSSDEIFALGRGGQGCCELEAYVPAKKVRVYAQVKALLVQLGTGLQNRQLMLASLIGTPTYIPPHVPPKLYYHPGSSLLLLSFLFKCVFCGKLGVGMTTAVRGFRVSHLVYKYQISDVSILTENERGFTYSNSSTTSLARGLHRCTLS